MISASVPSRIAAAQSFLQPSQALLLANSNHITYLTQFQFLLPEEREAFLVLTTQHVYLIHSSFSPLPEKQAWLTSLQHCHPSMLPQHITTVLKDNPNINQVLVDEEALFVHEYKQLTTLSQVTLQPFDHQMLWNLRMLKTDPEIAALRQAGKVAADTASSIISQLTIGMTEVEVKKTIDNTMRELGSQRPAFPTIVAFGPHAALPHHQPMPTPLMNNTPVLMDFGATVDGYRSDMTRTIWFGDKPHAEFTKVEQIVKKAYQTTLDLLRLRISQHLSITAKNLDQAARDVITQTGHGSHFIHTTGHGVGLDIHESPSLSWRNETEMKPGMAITIEPGIYLEGQFGYRYENTVLVTETGAEELTV